MSFFAFFPPSGGGTSTNASIGLNGVTAPTSSTEIAGINPSGNLQPLSVDASGNANVNVVSSTLPSGGATSANQLLEITQLTSANTTLTSINGHDANIDTATTAINAKVPALGQALAAASTPVVLTALQLAALTPPTTVTVVQPTGTNLHAVIDSSALPAGGSTSALQTAGNNQLTTIASNQTNGTQVTAINNFPSTQPVSIAGTVTTSDGSDGPAAPGTSAVKSVLQGIQFNTTLPTLTTGQQAAQQSDASGRILVGSIASALPVGANVIGGITAAQLPATLGAKTSALSTSVVLATDQAAVPIKSGNGTLTDNSGSTSATVSTSTTLMAINAARKYLLIQNLSTTATIYINFTSAASATAASIALLPLGAFVQESGFVTTELVTVLSATASVPYAAKQA